MCEESIIGTNLSRKATLLMAEVLHMGNKVLSLSSAARIQVWNHSTPSITHPLI
jgi:rapamycin-insensitive companion of mTOR